MRAAESRASAESQTGPRCPDAILVDIEQRWTAASDGEVRVLFEPVIADVASSYTLALRAEGVDMGLCDAIRRTAMVALGPPSGDTAAVPMYAALWGMFDEAKSCYATAMAHFGISRAVAASVTDAVTDYLVNHYGEA